MACSKVINMLSISISRFSFAIVYSKASQATKSNRLSAEIVLIRRTQELPERHEDVSTHMKIAKRKQHLTH